MPKPGRNNRNPAMAPQSRANPEQLPVIDFSPRNLLPGTASWLSTRGRVRAALEEHGCFVAETGILERRLHDEVFEDLEEVFDLPMERKMKNVSDRVYGGYLSHGTAKFISPLYESFGVQKASCYEGIEGFVKLMWPSGNLRFCENVNSYSKIVVEMEKVVKKMVFESYGLEEKLYDSAIASSDYLLRCMKYRVPKEGEDKIGAYTHTDKSFFTILHQNEVNGLEIQTKNGDYWIPPQFISPNSFLIMAGDASLAWSNGRIHSATHRVVMMNGSKDRYSIGLFSFHKGMTEIPSQMVDEEHPLKFNPFSNYGLLDSFSSNESPKLDSNAKVYCGIQPTE